MQQLLTKYPYISLTLLALICGILWRFEIEYHGWAGLGWLSYFHLAAPVGFILFLAWANAFVKMRHGKRLLLNASALLLGIISYYLIQFVSILSYGRSLIFTLSQMQFILIHCAFIMSIPFFPTSMFSLLRGFQIKLKVRYLFIAIVGMLIGIPLSIGLLEFTDHKGGSDIIHTIKSGFLIVIWTFCMGLLMLSIQKERPDEENDDDDLEVA